MAENKLSGSYTLARELLADYLTDPNNLQRWDEAIKQAKQVVADNPGRAEACYLAGVIFFSRHPLQRSN